MLPTYYIPIDEKRNTLRTRLKTEMENYGEKGLSIQGLADIICERRFMMGAHKTGQKYDKTAYEGTRKTLARQIGRYLTDNDDRFFFPKIQALMEIADVFDVQVSYLVGDYDERSKDAEWACEYTGLSEEAIEGIRLATAQTTSYDPDYMWHGDSTDILNRMLPSKAFFRLLEEMGRYERGRYEPNQAYLKRRRYEAEIGAELADKAYRCMDAFTAPGDPETEADNRKILIQEGIGEEDSEEFLEIVAHISGLIDEENKEDSEKALISKAYRFYIIEAFEQLLDEMYPL